MYRLVVRSSGKYNYTALGSYYYCLTKNSVIKLARFFHQGECDYEIEKFTHVCDITFTWSASKVSDKIWDKIIAPKKRKVSK